MNRLDGEIRLCEDEKCGFPGWGGESIRQTHTESGGERERETWTVTRRVRTCDRYALPRSSDLWFLQSLVSAMGDYGGPLKSEEQDTTAIFLGSSFDRDQSSPVVGSVFRIISSGGYRAPTQMVEAQQVLE